MSDCKKVVWFFVIFFATLGVLFLGESIYTNCAYGMVEAVPPQEEEMQPGFCPITRVVGKLHDCNDCHVVPTWELKESKPDGGLDYPTRGMYFEYEGRTPVKAHFCVGVIDSESIEKVFLYSKKHNVNHVVLEVNSPGGSLFGAARIVGLMRYWENQGVTVETRVHGMAVSAGLVVFVSGTPGHRFVSPQAELMWHELLSFKMFDIETPSSTEESMRILRHLQDTVNSWLAERSGMTKEELDEVIANKEYWMNGVEAVEQGFADGFLK